MVFPKECFEKDYFEKKKQQTTKMHEKLPSMRIVESINYKVNLNKLWEIEHLWFCLWGFVTC